MHAASGQLVSRWNLQV